MTTPSPAEHHDLHLVPVRFEDACAFVAAHPVGGE